MSGIERATVVHSSDITDMGKERQGVRESRRISMRNLGLEYLRFHHSNKYKYK